MHIDVEWDDPQRTILRYTYHQHWTWKDFEIAIQSARSMVDVGLPPQTILDILIDFTDSSLIPTNAFSNFEHSLHRPDALVFGVAVLIIQNSFLRRMLDLFRYLNPPMREKLRSADTLDDARVLLAQIRAERKTIPS